MFIEMFVLNTTGWMIQLFGSFESNPRSWD